MFLGGGVQEYVLAIRDGLNKRGHKAFIITPLPRSYKGPKHPGMIMIGTSAKWKAYGTIATISVSVDTDTLEEMLAREKFDILHFHEPWAPMLARQILSKSDTINIGTFHAAIPERLMGKTIEKVITPYTKSILKYLDVLTAVSSAATKYVSSLTPRKIYPVPNGIDTKKFVPSRTSRDNQKLKKLFYVGRLEKRKGVSYLLDAFKLISDKDPNYRLTIAGDGQDREKLMAKVKEDSIKNVEFIGFVEEKKKLELYANSDLFVSPAIYGESFGIVLLEAMASGCVTVAGNNPGYESVMTGTGQISIVDPKNSEDFARRIKLLANDEALRKVWRDWAIKEVKKYDYSNIIDAYELIYKAAYAKKNIKE